MVPVSVYLKKLLYQYDCVIVPQLGGFILHYLPATFQESSGLFLPPRKKVAFNQALKLDDGVLINYMMLHEQISRDEVKQRIVNFVDELKQEVRRNGSFAVEGIGLFSGNEEGSLQFDPELRHNFFGESFGMQPVAVTLAASETQEPTAGDGPVEESVTQETEVPVIALSSQRRRQWGWAAAVVLLASVGVMSYLTVSRVPGQLASSLNPFDFVWTLRTETPKPKEPARPAAPLAEARPEAKSPAAPLPTVTAPAEPVVPVIPAVTPTSAKLRYIVVAGSFNSRRNARKLFKFLHRKGFETAYIMPIRKGELVKVAASATNLKTEAVAMAAEVSKKVGAQAWIYKSY